MRDKCETYVGAELSTTKGHSMQSCVSHVARPEDDDALRVHWLGRPTLS